MENIQEDNDYDDEITSNDTEDLIRINRMYLTRKQKIYYFLIPISAALLVGFLIGFLSGYLPKRNNNDNGNNSGQNGNNVDMNLLKYYESLVKDIDESYFELLQNEVNASVIRQNLEDMTKIPHLAGTKGDYDSAQYVYNKWKEQNLDYVKIIDYNVLLSYPDENNPNNIQFLSETDEVLETLNITEPVLDVDGLNYTGTPFPFLAYALGGSVSSDEIYYVNFCSEEDFQYFTRNLTYNVTGKLVICRYGEIFRGDKVLNAERYGAAGVILYDDPLRSAPPAAKDEIYPNGEFLPKDGTQRGTLFTGSGDPESPLYPSAGDEFRQKGSSTKGLPNIPAQVIGYNYAQKIFEYLENNTPVDSKWAGIMNVSYTYGGALQNNTKLKINVLNQRRVEKTHNVIGMIKGTIEPDRYVMIGNHRDAWVFGSIDPTSGTAALVEISRTLSSLKKHGWQPRRSIVFLSWGAEEYGLIGSTEWVEEFNKKLNANAVAYLNLDISVQGNYSYTARASPLLTDIIYAVTKKVKLTNEETVYDRWLKYAPNDDKTLPYISPELGAGSDYMAFQQRVGIPCMDSRFNHEKSDKYRGIGSGYPLYHTNYETFRLVDKFIDPGFNSFRIISIITAEIARTLSDSLIIPLRALNYVNQFNVLYKDLVDEYGEDLKAQNISLDGLSSAIKKYQTVAKSFDDRLNSFNKSYITLVNQYNEQLRNIEKSFLIPQYIEREGYMHAISAPSLYNQYAGDGFPALSDAIYSAKVYPKSDSWDNVRLQLSIAIYAINSVCKVLDVPDSFER